MFIPDYAYKGKTGFTASMLQYWGVKKQNYDKILLFKLGSFYEIFYNDAFTCHRVLDLNWMGQKVKVGFPEKRLEKYASILVENGYKVAVVEQTESKREMDKRIAL